MLKCPHNIAPCLDMTRFITNYGFDNGETIRNVVRKLLTIAGLSGDATLGDMNRLLQKEFVCCTTDLHTGHAIYLSHLTHKELGVAEAVFMSMCVPLLFTPVCYKDMLHVDGSLSHNIPHYFPKNDTLYFVFQNENRRVPIHTWTDYIGAIISQCMCNIKHRRIHPHKNSR